MIVEWFEHPLMLELNQLVYRHMDRDCIKEYHRIDGDNIADFRTNVEHWVEDRQSVLEDISKMLEDFPDSEEEMIDLDNE
jgi:hypothetical protein